jgi:hypothetical protein
MTLKDGTTLSSKMLRALRIASHHLYQGDHNEFLYQRPIGWYITPGETNARKEGLFLCDLNFPP